MQMFHISKVSVIPDGIGILAERLIDNLTGRDIPPFRVDHFGNFEDGLFVVLSENGWMDINKTNQYRREVEDAIVSVKKEFGLEYFSGKWVK